MIPDPKIKGIRWLNRSDRIIYITLERKHKRPLINLIIKLFNTSCCDRCFLYPSCQEKIVDVKCYDIDSSLYLSDLCEFILHSEVFYNFLTLHNEATLVDFIILGVSAYNGVQQWNLVSSRLKKIKKNV